MNEPSLTTFNVTGFEKYVSDSKDAPAGLVAFFAVFVGFSVILTIPILCWRDRKQQLRLESALSNESHGDNSPGQQEMVNMSTQTQTQPTAFSADQTTPTSVDRETKDEVASRRDSEPRLEHANGDNAISNPGDPPTRLTSSDPHPHTQHANADDRLSAAPSVASTSRLRGDGILNTGSLQHRRRPSGAWGMAASRRPWGHSRPVGRADFVRSSLEAERQSQASEEGSHASRRSRMSRVSARPGQRSRSHAISDAASSILSGEVIEGESEFYRQRWMRRSRNRHRRAPSESDASLMPPLSPDALSPEDAADAHDVGRRNRPEDYEQDELPPILRSGPLKTILACCDTILDLADHDYEAQRILSLAIPSTIGAVADPLFRLILLAIISYFVKDTNSLASYVLVILFLRLTTEEISGAVTDVESNLVKDALAQGGDVGFIEAGRYVQQAIAMQFLVGAPLLLVWVFVMDDVVLWFLRDPNVWDGEMAGIAGEYTSVIVIDYILRGITRAFMLPFHLNGQAQFERNIDVLAALLTLVAIIAVAAMLDRDGEPSLFYIGCIQVIIGIAATIIKVTYVVLRGWLQPYQRGLLGSFGLDFHSLFFFLTQVLPLFIGSLLELGEWDVLILFVKHLGAGEVASWAIMGIVWEVCLAVTEGLGEAASVRVSYYLSEGAPVEAKMLASKVAFLACVEALVVTSIFLIAGPNISSLLTTDAVLQSIIKDMMGLLALANIPMTLAQVYWSLVGAQGKYAIASATILVARWLVTIPMAAVFVFGFHYDLDSLAGAVASGYATAAFVLSLHVFNADWVRLSMAVQEELSPVDEDDDDLSDSDDSSSIVF